MKWKGYFGTQRQKLRNHKGRACSFIFACSALVFFLFAAAPAHVKAGGGISAETQKKSGAMVTIDANKKYEGMNAPFSKGYEPSIKKNKMSLIIPFRLEQETRITGLLLGFLLNGKAAAPFIIKITRKK